PVVGTEIEGPADVEERIWIGATARVDVGDLRRAGVGAVRLPQLGTRAVVGAEEDGVADQSKMLRPGIARRIDVLHPDGACGGAVAAPQLVAALAVRRAEVEDAADVEELARRGPSGRIQIDHRHGTDLRPVALPELGSDGGIDGTEEHGVAGVGDRGGREVVEDEARRDVTHAWGAGFGGGALPQLAA